ERGCDVDAILGLEDGRVFTGRAFGASGTRTGEVVFNTSMTGYQEVLTDPSYCGQIVVMTYPLVGNCGVNDEDVESDRPQVEGFCVREFSHTHSNWRSRKDLPQYLRENGIPAISEVDTRALTRHIRMQGAMRGALSTGGLTAEQVVTRARQAPRLAEIDLVGQVSTSQPYRWSQPRDREWDIEAPGPPPQRRLAVVAYDFGIKRNILRYLTDHGCDVTVVPAGHTAEDTLALHPDGVFLSNGPGDPESNPRAIDAVKYLSMRVPMFGICLGHQIMGLALGASTFKLKFGHRGANHPVKDLASGRVAITSQNHGFAVDPATLPDEVESTHVNLNDGTCEGFQHRRLPLFAVQYHPESSPGPHDAGHLFSSFLALMGRVATATPPAADDLGRQIPDSKGRRRTSNPEGDV
ncbi:MAG: glutamine-hydrolyzing carbamoyl-phosphate synthase small subunit, partial [Acidobacteriota bacterium]